MRGVRDGVLLVGHGTRNDKGVGEFLAFVEMVRREFPEKRVESGFVELAYPSIGDAIDKCVGDGLGRLLVAPVILFPAMHVKRDIPSAVSVARSKHPSLDIHYGKSLGVHSLLLEILNERLASAERTLSTDKKKETAVLLVGRGSSDPSANSKVYEVARLLWESNGFSFVETCFIGVTLPNLDQGLERCLKLGASRIIVQPLFLFTGVLSERLASWVEDKQARNPNIDLALAARIWPHQNLAKLAAERIGEALSTEATWQCGKCKYMGLVSQSA